jgi:hypothetical protein
MSMTAFFPWLCLKEQLQAGEFELIPYKRGQAPGGAGTESQRILDSIMSPYRAGGDRSINKATVVRVNQGDLIRDLDEDERRALFVLSEVLSVAGLSRREFFKVASLGYQNRDNFRIIIQAFAEAGGGAAITSRRRDGSTTNYWSGDSYRIQKPEHVHVNPINHIDEPLLQSLLQARDSQEWERFYESILSFNLANTDNSEIAEEVELVLLSGALERLFDCRRGQEEDLATRFTSTLSPSEERSPTSCGRLSTPELTSRFKRSSSVRDMWVRDLFRLRGNLAHGKIESRYRPVWSLREHLLLGSFVFPLVLKLELTKSGLYEISEEDQGLIDLFEALASEDLFVPVSDPNGPNSYPWRRVFQRAAEDRWRLRNDYKPQTGFAGVV